jgi:CRP-like cAMP-binding protein
MNKYLLDQILTKLKAVKLLLAKGESLFLQDDETVNFYYVKTGKIKLIRNTMEGGQALIHVALPGETFAEASLFSNKYHCSAIADAESEILSYKKPEMLRFLEQNPAAMKDLLKMFSQQVRDLRTINEIKNIYSAKGRILAFISHEMNDSKEVYLAMSLKDVAYKLGLAHETFYRELKKLEREKVLMRQDRYLKLL